jgi:hypothetical protein
LPAAGGIAGLVFLVVIPFLDLHGANLAVMLAVAASAPLAAARYFLSPAWKLRVLADDEGLAVLGPRDAVRFRLPWGEIKQVVCAPSSKTCFIDGGTPERSIAVPGPGLPAAYMLEDREVLYDLVMEHVPADRRREVASLDAPTS